jgi:predicted amidohydrolase YtcJ
VSGGPTGARFRDAHTHLAAGAADLSDLDLRGVQSADEIVLRVAAAAAGRPRGRWIRGWGWSGATGLPMRESGTTGLDHVAPEHPVFLARRDGHAAWLNRAARAELTLAPQTVRVDEDDYDAVRRRLPPLSSGARMDALTKALAAFEQQGIASLDDFVEPWAPDLYAQLADRGALRLRVGLWLPESIAPADAEALRRAFPPGAGPVAVRGIKIFLDGTLGARTAALSRPYADAPGSSGALRVPEREIAERVGRWARRDWPVALHAIGDRAVTLALDALAAAPRPARGAHRIEHAQVVLRSDLPRFAAAGIVASVQPGHWRDDRPFLASRLGARPDVAVHPLASLARAGATLLFGSDWPVSPFAPAEVVEAAADPQRGDEALERPAALAAASA